MSTAYVAKTPNDSGFIDYTPIEDQTWKTLYDRQMEVIKNRACDEYMQGLDILGLSRDSIPQLPDVNRALKKATGWEVAAVPALIPFDEFFELLASKRFPAATFIRTPEELDYLQEPDIFHEIFGHCPLLTDPVFAKFVENYGKLGLHASKKERVYLARLFWFTVEFGLIQKTEGLRIYGAGILSSIGETPYSLENAKPERKPFDLMTALRTPYRIDIYQSVYFVINSFHEIYGVMDVDLLNKINEAIELGDFEPTFPPKKSNVVKIKETHDC
ncbi:phenylalanine 4-monooxygenase [Pleionea sediminis]|uniref:phenylalanine 4-monooxygenase n=1 Tax=Pleionea sediminis TaxID=2569479 RepID=UPI001185E59C|nr:phenylalanine 4-monooxygenase [Pleionea sediminis]